MQFMGPDTRVSAAKGRGNEYRHTTNYKKTKIKITVNKNRDYLHGNRVVCWPVDTGSRGTLPPNNSLRLYRIALHCTFYSFLN